MTARVREGEKNKQERKERREARERAVERDATTTMLLSALPSKHSRRRLRSGGRRCSRAFVCAGLLLSIGRRIGCSPVLPCCHRLSRTPAPLLQPYHVRFIRFRATRALGAPYSLSRTRSVIAPPEKRAVAFVGGRKQTPTEAPFSLARHWAVTSGRRAFNRRVMRPRPRAKVTEQNRA